MALALRLKRAGRRALDADVVFDSRLAAVALRREHVLAIGDSHVHVLRHVHLPHVLFRVRPVKGATASGVLNPNSRTQALPIFTELLDAAAPWQHVLVHLGEVDCGFVIWHRAATHGIPVEEQLAETVAAYAEFVRTVAARGFRSTAVLSAPLPTIADYPEQWGKVANLRSAVTATQFERTELTLRFNEQVAAACAGIGAVYLDATSAQLDQVTGLVADRFIKTSSRDHHLAGGPYADLVARALRHAGWPR